MERFVYFSLSCFMCFTLMILLQATPSLASPHGPGHEECGHKWGPTHPKFHVNHSCGINDPNGPFYDPKHGMYHLFYQDHQGEPAGGRGKGPVWGHVVSRDLAHWARLPVAIWNDHWYDEIAIFTGSATVIDGDPVITYPGFCSTTRPECAKTQFTLNVAVPTDRDDPFLRNWTKPAYNPVLDNSPDDPSSMWQTPSGEWRHTSWDGGIYGSKNLINWTAYGRQYPGAFRPMDCPSLFPLPQVPSDVIVPEGVVMPTHVHKGSDYKMRVDFVQFGNWTDGLSGPEGTPGQWLAAPGVNFQEQRIDHGPFYAAKDFYDPVKNRRILWGWAQVAPASALTLPREVKYHPVLQQLLFNPIEEIGTLRQSLLGSAANISLGPSSPATRVALGSAAQADLALKFSLPQSWAMFGAEVLAYANDTEGLEDSGHGLKPVGLFLWTNYTPGADSVAVGASLVKPGPGVRLQGKWDRLKVLPTDKEIDIRVVVDSTVVEVFWLGGRVAMTVDSAAASRGTQLAVSVFQGCDMKVQSAAAWQMGSGWVTPEEVLHSSRPAFQSLGNAVAESIFV